MTKKAEALSRKLVAEPGPKPAPPLRWRQLTVDGILYFIVCNEVDSPDQQVRLEQLRLAHEPGSKDRLHLSVVGDRGADVLMVLRVALNVLIRRPFITAVEAATIFAPVQNAIRFHLHNDVPLHPPVSNVVVQLKSGDMYTGECKNIRGYLLHLLLLESHVKADAATDELNQPVQHKR